MNDHVRNTYRYLVGKQPHTIKLLGRHHQGDMTIQHLHVEDQYTAYKFTYWINPTLKSDLTNIAMRIINLKGDY